MFITFLNIPTMRNLEQLFRKYPHLPTGTLSFLSGYFIVFSRALYRYIAKIFGYFAVIFGSTPLSVHLVGCLYAFFKSKKKIVYKYLFWSVFHGHFVVIFSGTLSLIFGHFVVKTTVSLSCNPIIPITIPIISPIKRW